LNSPTQFKLFSGNQYWFGLRKPPCQFLFGVCPCLQLFGNISYSLYSNRNESHSTSSVSTSSGDNSSQTDISIVDLINEKKSAKAAKKEALVVPPLTIEMPD
jgi:hypothetical protein